MTKTAFLTLWLSLGQVATFAQGTVNFINTPTTLVSAGPVGQETPISGPAGSYDFALLIAAPGTTDKSQFTFTGLYATNINDGRHVGRLFGGTDVQAPGWGQGVFMSYLVAGWSASLGHDWDQRWLSGIFITSGDFGLSSIATGVPGGPNGGVPFAAYNLFGGATGIQIGWNLAPVTAIPEPSIGALAALGGLVLVFKSRSGKRFRKPWRAYDAEPPLCTGRGHRVVFANGRRRTRASESKRCA